METVDVSAVIQLLEAEGILHEAGELKGYASDASFLTLGVPNLIVFPKDEAECVKLVEMAVKHRLALVPRGTASSTAGASVAPAGALLVDMQRVGACDARGHRRGLFTPQVVSAKGEPADLAKAGPEDELYVRVGAGRTSDETNRALAKAKWVVGVTPSSGYSTFGGNFATNARGSGTPAYGAFGDAVNRLRLVTSTKEGAHVVEVSEREEILRLAGNHGLFGLITELDVRIAPILKAEEMLCAILSIESPDAQHLGAVMGALMKRIAASCQYFAGEFLFIDAGIVRPDDPVRNDPVLGGYFVVTPGVRKMVLVYRGKKAGMAALPAIAAESREVAYREITYAQFRTMMGVRTAATGKSLHRVNVPGCEDFLIEDPSRFGDVLAAMFAVTAGADGRPVGHHYPDGVVVHYRPQMPVNRSGIEQGWALNQRLRDAVLKKEFTVSDRVEHGLGLALFKDTPKKRQDELRKLKAKYDPANVFCPHLLEKGVEGRFVGAELVI